MITINLPEANNAEVPLGRFIAAWQIWFDMFGGHEATTNWTDSMPVYGSDKALEIRLQADNRYVYSLDVLCRLMGPYPDTRQTSEAFFRLNSCYVSRAGQIKGFTGRQVKAAQLTAEALKYWDQLDKEAKEQHYRDAHVLIEEQIGDIGDFLTYKPETRGGSVPSDNGSGPALSIVGIPTATKNKPANVPLLAPDARLLDYLRALVSWIHHDTYRANYRRKPVRSAVLGWDNRLSGYFWPRPEYGYVANHDSLERITLEAQPLVLSIESNLGWGDDQKQKAVEIAQRIFAWGGVPQKDVTAEKIEAVVRAALSADRESTAEMNSGWTKVAAIMTAHLEHAPDRLPMSISDSRVANALIYRLDQMLQLAGGTPETLFDSLGTIPGRGGSRPRQYQLAWKDGYRKWWMQVFVSELIRDMRDILNQESDPVSGQPYPRMPLPSGGTGPWTCRGVEMVLFMDGY